MDAIFEVIFHGLLVALFFSFILYIYITSSYCYWQARNVPYAKPNFPFGNLGDTVMGRKSLVDLLLQQYKQFEGNRYFGIFHFSRPVLVLRDPSLIKSILITDFSYFCDRVDGVTKNKDLLAYYLGNLQGNTWRQFRQKLIKAFSNAKLKQMTDQISLSADRLVERISEYESKKKPLNGDCFGYGFYQETTASCAFGIECDSEGIKEFCKNVKRLLFGGKIKVVNSLIIWYLYLPQYAKYLYYIPTVAKFVEYFRHLTASAIELRKVSGSKRNDFLQILIDLNEEELTVEDINNQDQFELRKSDDLSLRSSNKYNEQQFLAREVNEKFSVELSKWNLKSHYFKLEHT